MNPAPTKKTEQKTLLEFYEAVRRQTEELCEPLEVEDYIPQPIVDVSPAKWNIGHTTWFFEEMILKRFAPDYRVFDSNFGFLFNSYYNTIGDRTARDHRGNLSRPTVKQVFEYRRHVDAQMTALLAGNRGAPAGAGANRDGVDVRSTDGNAAEPALAELVILGLNHEQQHQELFLTDLKYTFSVNPLFPAYREGFAPEESLDRGTAHFNEIAGGIYEIGHTGGEFCFDNELTRHKVLLNDFRISDRLVTNGEFIEFVNDGGYRDHRLWHSEGWDWVNRENVASPLYWHDRDGLWHHFTLGGLRRVPLDAPVCHISFYEASAFAEWRGMRLPTEFEWEAANERFNWGLRWEWTNSAYLPYPGFLKPDGAVGEYNGKFMINQMVLRGASVATPDGHSRPTYRNFFHPHLRWQFTGVRLAK
jgi:ergothioneine biosynthesis protein EgtB